MSIWIAIGVILCTQMMSWAQDSSKDWESSHTEEVFDQQHSGKIDIDGVHQSILMSIKRSDWNKAEEECKKLCEHGSPIGFLDLAYTYYKMKHYEDSLEVFQWVLENYNPPANVRARVKKWILVLKEVIKKRYRWTNQVRVTSGYNSNITTSSDSDTIEVLGVEQDKAESFKKKSSAVSSFIYQGSKYLRRPILGDRQKFTVAGSYYKTWEESRYNFGLAKVGTLMEWDNIFGGKVVIPIDTWVSAEGDEFNLVSGHTRLSWVRPIMKGVFVVPSFDWIQRKGIGDHADSVDLTGHIGSVGGALIVMLGQTCKLNIYGSGKQHRGYKKEYYQYNSMYAGATLSGALCNKAQHVSWLYTLTASIEKKDFQERHPIDSKEREDTVMLYRLKLKKHIGRSGLSFDPGVEVTYKNNSSNVDRRDYDQLVVAGILDMAF